ncbi:hypothetical protein ABFY27_16635 [Akkermansia massiliensis]
MASFRNRTGNRRSGRTGLFKDGEFQAPLDIVGVNHGAEDGAEARGSTEKIDVFSDEPHARAGRDQFSFGVKVSGLFGLVHHIDQVQRRGSREFLRSRSGTHIALNHSLQLVGFRLVKIGALRQDGIDFYFVGIPGGRRRTVIRIVPVDALSRPEQGRKDFHRNGLVCEGSGGMPFIQNLHERPAALFVRRRQHDVVTEGRSGEEASRNDGQKRAESMRNIHRRRKTDKDDGIISRILVFFSCFWEHVRTSSYKMAMKTQGKIPWFDS